VALAESGFMQGPVSLLFCWAEWNCVMFKMDLDDVWRTLKAIFCFVGAVWIIWRGNAYDTLNYSLLPAVMCAISGMVLVFLGLALVFRSGEVGEE
jgi:hypothetical protein